jgi:hypothetical protein
MSESYIHTRRLAEFLAMDAMGAVELKKTVEHSVPRELSYHDYDGKVVNARELLISEGIQGSTLIPTEIYATVIEGSEPVRCWREVLPTVQMKGAVMTMPYGETGTYAGKVAEGAEIPIEDQTYASVTFTAAKYGVRPLITNEMIDDALFDIMAMEMRKSGARMENALNRACLHEIMDAYGNSDDRSSGATPLLGLANLQQSMLADNQSPSQIIFHPACYAACQAEGLVLSTQFANDMLRSGVLGQILGMPTRMSSIASSGSTKTWGFANASEVGALMLDTSRCGAIGMRQDIKVDQFADNIRQMQGVVLSMRFDCQALMTDAIGGLLY